MRRFGLCQFLGALSLALLLAGCGGPTTPQAALQQQFALQGQNPRIYPFHDNLARGYRLYFLDLPGSTIPSPTAAILHRYQGNWLVTQYVSIPYISGCRKPIAVSFGGLMAVGALTGRRQIAVGRIEGSAAVGSLVYSLGTEQSNATLLRDGFWLAPLVLPSVNLNAPVQISLHDAAGRQIPACFF